MTTIVFFDFETNGLRRDGYGEHPTQLSVVVTDEYGAVRHTYSEFVRGATRLSPWVQQNMPKFTLAKLDDVGVPLDDALDQLRVHLGPDSLFVAHNASFDLGVWERHETDSGTKRRIRGQRHLCTMKAGTDFCALPKTGYAARYAGFKYPKLVELAEALGEPCDPAACHDAAYDTDVLRRCFVAGRKKGIW